MNLCNTFKCNKYKFICLKITKGLFLVHYFIIKIQLRFHCPFSFNCLWHPRCKQPLVKVSIFLFLGFSIVNLRSLLRLIKVVYLSLHWIIYQLLKNCFKKKFTVFSRTKKFSLLWICFFSKNTPDLEEFLSGLVHKNPYKT